jgi:hypothetical protein
MLHASDSTPDPITPVIMCATAFHAVPSSQFISQSLDFELRKDLMRIIIKKIEDKPVLLIPG